MRPRWAQPWPQPRRVLGMGTAGLGDGSRHPCQCPWHGVWEPPCSTEQDKAVLLGKQTPRPCPETPQYPVGMRELCWELDPFPVLRLPAVFPALARLLQPPEPPDPPDSVGGAQGAGCAAGQGVGGWGEITAATSCAPLSASLQCCSGGCAARMSLLSPAWVEFLWTCCGLHTLHHPAAPVSHAHAPSAELSWMLRLQRAPRWGARLTERAAQQNSPLQKHPLPFCADRRDSHFRAPCSSFPGHAVLSSPLPSRGAGLAGGRRGRKHEAGAWNDSSFPEGTWAQCCWLRDLLMQFLLQVRKLKTRGSSPGPRSGQESPGPFPQCWQEEPGRPESRKSCSDPFFFLFSSSFGGQCSNFYLFPTWTGRLFQSP